MNIRVSHEELLSLLSKALGTQVTQYEIAPSVLVARLEANVTPLIGKKGMVVPAIKALREITSMTLSDAAYALNNWTTFMSFVRKHNHVPLGTVFAV